MLKIEEVKDEIQVIRRGISVKTRRETEMLIGCIARSEFKRSAVRQAIGGAGSGELQELWAALSAGEQAQLLQKLDEQAEESAASSIQTALNLLLEVEDVLDRCQITPEAADTAALVFRRVSRRLLKRAKTPLNLTNLGDRDESN